MGIPKTDRQIRRIVENKAKQTLMSRRVFRKAGILMGTTVLPRPRTILEGIISPFEHHLARIWWVDLTSVSQIRFTCEADQTMVLNRATGTDGTVLDTSWAAMTGLDESEASVVISASRATTDAGDLLWRTIPESLRGAQRFALGHTSGEVELDPNRLDGPFSFAVQVL